MKKSINNMFLDNLKNLEEKYGVDVRECSPYHFQLRGIHLINLYPSKGTYYIQGTEKKINYTSLEEVFKVCVGVNNVSAQISKTPRKNLKNKKQLLWEKSKFCYFCGGEFKNIEETTIEHKIPLSRGGSNRIDNLALSHATCNQDRKDDIKVSVSVNEKRLIEVVNKLREKISVQEEVITTLKKAVRRYGDRGMWNHSNLWKPVFLPIGEAVRGYDYADEAMDKVSELDKKLEELKDV